MDFGWLRCVNVSLLFVTDYYSDGGINSGKGYSTVGAGGIWKISVSSV